MRRRKLRRGRYHPRWRRFYRGRRFRRRRYGWRPRQRVRYHKVLQHIPKRHTRLFVRGWEPLGTVCKSDGPKSEATPYFSVEPQANTSTAVWHGTWGKHYFTFNNLLQRAKARWCLFSRDWESYDYMLFLGGTILIPQTSHVDWIINFDEYLQTHLIRYNEQSKEDHWDHPGILLNTPRSHIIFSPWKYRHQKMYKIKIKPPPGWTGMQRFPEAMGYVCMHWAWTACNFENAFYDVRCEDSTRDSCQAAPWWDNNKYVAGKWVDRTLYKDNTSCTNEEAWGPFLPRSFTQAEQSSLFFLYRLKFKLAGNAIWRPLPRQFQSEGMVPDPEGPLTPSKASHKPEASQPANKRRKRPLHEADIWPGDLDSDGFIKKRAYRRITSNHTRDERHTLENARFCELQQRLRNILGEHDLLRK